MRVTLDWDTEEEREQYESQAVAFAEGQLAGATEAKPYELRRSSGGDGYHFLIYGAVNNWGDVVGRRQDLGDDPKRLRLDLMRRQRGSPFLQVLYSRKYMSRWGWKPETGNAVETMDGIKHVPEPNRIKENGRLQYNKIARILSEEEYGTVSSLADAVERARTTVSGWVNNQHEPNDAGKKRLRRLARSRGIGHYVDTDDGGKSADTLPGVEVEYFDRDEMDFRRTIVEYISVPWADDPEQIERNVGEEDESEERLLNVHTGTWNGEISESQLKRTHDDIEAHARDILSPRNKGNELPGLDLDRENNIGRESDSVNYEEEPLDRDETEFYISNMVDKTKPLRVNGEPRNPENYMLFEVILWDENVNDILWHVIGAWTGESVSDATILRDSKGWF